MLKRKSIYAWISVLMVSISGFCMDTMNGDEVRTPQKLRIGTTISVFGGLEGLTYENLFILNDQWFMILSLPFILLYNDQRGRKMKYFFYVYYPLHVYLLVILARIVA